jgi:hypothetical protein
MVEIDILLSKKTRFAEFRIISFGIINIYHIKTEFKL